MPETKPIEPAYRRHDFTKMPESVARPEGDKTWTKYGIEQDIQDFINAGAEQASIIKHVENAGGIENLRANGIKDINDEVIDRGMDFITLNRVMKVINVAKQKLEREAEIKAQEQEQEQKTKDNNNGE